MWSFSDRLTKPKNVLVQRVPEGDSVLLNVTSGQYFGLDSMGNTIFEKLVAGESIQSVYEALMSEYEVDSAQLQTDLTKLIDELVANELLAIVRS